MNMNKTDMIEVKNMEFLYNACRCCLTKITNGDYKDISREYYCSGQKEIYEEMLKYVFNIEISCLEYYAQSNYSCVICEECISKLRDANIFKRTVLESEQTIFEYINSVDSNDSEIEVPLDIIKIETEEMSSVHADQLIEDDVHIYVDECQGVVNNEILTNLKEEPDKDIDKLLECQSTTKRKLPQRTKKKPKRFKEEEGDHNYGIKKNEKSQDDWKKITERRGFGPILRKNTINIISNSTICVFQYNKGWYKCFCCTEAFPDFDVLRIHTDEHSLEDIERKIVLQQNRLVKVDVSKLTCKLCNKVLQDLPELRSHLDEKHRMCFDVKDDLLVPYKNDGNLMCQICKETFSTFRLLNIHMNKHFQNQVCDVCGASFSNLVFLNLHKSRSHRLWKCKVCDLTFSNKVEKRQHDISRHNIETVRKPRFPCAYCKERFYQENIRVQHMVDKHSMIKPEYKCEFCTKVFITRSLCNNHMKKVHMKVKNKECDICHLFFYTQSDVSRHRVTHTGEKNFTCTLCNSQFATKDSLRRHMKRTHVVN